MERGGGEQEDSDTSAAAAAIYNDDDDDGDEDDKSNDYNRLSDQYVAATDRTRANYNEADNLGESLMESRLDG